MEFAEELSCHESSAGVPAAAFLSRRCCYMSSYSSITFITLKKLSNVTDDIITRGQTLLSNDAVELFFG